MKTIKATDETIREIVKSEIEKLGNEADLNHIDVSQVTDMSKLCFQWQTLTEIYRSGTYQM